MPTRGLERTRLVSVSWISWELALNLAALAPTTHLTLAALAALAGLSRPGPRPTRVGLLSEDRRFHSEVPPKPNFDQNCQKHLFFQICVQ